MKNFFWKIHRWIGLLLAPFFALILITGAILAFKPILAPQFADTPIGNRAPALLAAVDQAAAGGADLQSLTLDKNGQVFWASGGKNVPLSAYSLSNGAFVQEGGMSPKLFSTVKELHKELLIDADFVVEIAAYAMVAMILIGLIFMMRPRLQKRLMAWHNALGVVFLPLWLLLPLTGVLMTLDAGKPNLKALSEDSPPVVGIVHQLAQQNQLQNLVSIDSIKKRTVIRLSANNGTETVQMDEDGQLTPVNIGTYWVKELHEGTWAGKFSGWLNAALSLSLLCFLISGVYTWLRRRLRNRAQTLPVLPVAGSQDQRPRFLVAHASQTGVSEKLAKQTAAALQAQGVAVHTASMAAIRAEQLADFECCFLICSTTGEGDLPDAALRLEKELRSAHLPKIRYALLALGDKNYARFCGGGRKLAEALNAARAQSVLPTRLVDGAPHADWQEWLGQLGGIFHFQQPANSTAGTADLPLRLRLIEKYRLDNPEFSHREVWAFTFEIPQNTPFRGGDLLLITPPGEKIARTYSIGSDAQGGNHVRLTVGLHRFIDDDGQLQDGRASSWLIRELAVGDTLNAALRHHPSFNLPDDQHPVIMVAIGTGIAPLIGFVPRLQQQKRPAWLFFGNSHAQGNDFYRQEWDEALANQSLSRINKVFDNQNQGFVQDELLRHGAEIYQWLCTRNARVFVCGRGNTVGRGSENALMQIYREHGGHTEAEAAEWLLQLKADERLRMDLFG